MPMTRLRSSLILRTSRYRSIKQSERPACHANDWRRTTTAYSESAGPVSVKSPNASVKRSSSLSNTHARIPDITDRADDSNRLRSGGWDQFSSHCRSRVRRSTQALQLPPSLEDRVHALPAGTRPKTPRARRVPQLCLCRLHPTRLPAIHSKRF